MAIVCRFCIQKSESCIFGGYPPQWQNSRIKFSIRAFSCMAPLALVWYFILWFSLCKKKWLFFFLFSLTSAVFHVFRNTDSRFFRANFFDITTSFKCELAGLFRWSVDSLRNLRHSKSLGPAIRMFPKLTDNYLPCGVHSQYQSTTYDISPLL